MMCRGYGIGMKTGGKSFSVPLPLPRPPQGKFGVTLLEVLVVAALSTFILWGATMMMNWTNRSYKRTTDIVNNQLTLEMIVESLRIDVSRLREVLPEEGEAQFSFRAKRKGWDIRVEYSFDPETRTLVRKERIGTGNPNVKDFRSAGKIESLTFRTARAPDGEFDHVDVSLQVRSDEKGEGRPGRVAFFCRFFSKCTRGFSPFTRKDGVEK